MRKARRSGTERGSAEAGCREPGAVRSAPAWRDERTALSALQDLPAFGVLAQVTPGRPRLTHRTPSLHLDPSSPLALVCVPLRDKCGGELVSQGLCWSSHQLPRLESMSLPLGRTLSVEATRI